MTGPGLTFDELARASTAQLAAAVAARGDTTSGRAGVRRIARARRRAQFVLAVLAVLAAVGAAVAVAGVGRHQTQPAVPPKPAPIIGGMGGVRVIDPATGIALSTRCVGDVVAASPDGTQVAVMSTGRRVSTCNLRTGATSTVAQFFGLLPAVRWTSTAISVASFDEHQHLVIDVVQGSHVSHQTYPLPPDGIGGGAWPSWSPDGTRLVLGAADALYVVNADGSNAHALYTLPNGAGYIGPVTWSPDGRHIAFLQWGMSQFQGPAHLILIAPDGSGRTDLDPAYYGEDDRFEKLTIPEPALAWSPDSDAIAYYTGQDPAHPWTVAVHDLRSGNTHWIDDHASGWTLTWATSS